MTDFRLPSTEQAAARERLIRCGERIAANDFARSWIGEGIIAGATDGLPQVVAEDIVAASQLLVTDCGFAPGWTVMLLDDDGAPFAFWAHDPERQPAPDHLTARTFLLDVAERCRDRSPRMAEKVRMGALDDLPDAVVAAACRCVYYRCTEARAGAWSVAFFDEFGERTFTWTYGPPHIWRTW